VIYVGFYALLHGVKEARFYVAGWSLVLVALILTNLQTLGAVPINEGIGYLNYAAIAAEAFLFSIALAHRIKVVNEQWQELQQEKQSELEQAVAQKTNALHASLQKEELLRRELNHRIKNNFQMILSLIRLQIHKTDSSTTRRELSVAQDRIRSIARLYDILRIDQRNAQDVRHYFQAIVDYIAAGFAKNVQVRLRTSVRLPVDQMIYCGLIVNELVTNSFKHAFDQTGRITILLLRHETHICLVVRDNGRGYVPQPNDHALGMSIVKTLVEKELLGTIQIRNRKGTETIISWQIPNP
jgi:two-component sensor histidine kinase